MCLITCTKVMVFFPSKINDFIFAIHERRTREVTAVDVKKKWGTTGWGNRRIQVHLKAAKLIGIERECDYTWLVLVSRLSDAYRNNNRR